MTPSPRYVFTHQLARIYAAHCVGSRIQTLFNQTVAQTKYAILFAFYDQESSL